MNYYIAQIFALFFTAVIFNLTPALAETPETASTTASPPSNGKAIAESQSFQDYFKRLENKRENYVKLRDKQELGTPQYSTKDKKVESYNQKLRDISTFKDQTGRKFDESQFENYKNIRLAEKMLNREVKIGTEAPTKSLPPALKQELQRQRENRKINENLNEELQKTDPNSYKRDALIAERNKLNPYANKKYQNQYQQEADQSRVAHERNLPASNRFQRGARVGATHVSNMRARAASMIKKRFSNMRTKAASFKFLVPRFGRGPR